ncbi:MAG: nucleoside deaminase [Betaproteobacteria bacterium]|nr:nucleoside deaminase [Betaproteobacteria bacterium]MDH3438560.1 nucleoside deaminase [Betaproteobacteria bacterium]
MALQSPARRRVLYRITRLGGAALALTGVSLSAVRAAAPDAERQRFMAHAYEMRRRAIASGDQAFGAVVVKNGQVVGEGVSAVLTTPDPTAHGEMQAIRDAARRLGSAKLAGCELYTTFQPCQMCETAAYWAGIERIFYGEAVTDGGAPRYRSC